MPDYELPPELEKIEILRVVVRGSTPPILPAVYFFFRHDLPLQPPLSKATVQVARFRSLCGSSISHVGYSVTLDNMYDDRVRGKSRNYLPGQTFTVNYPTLDNCSLAEQNGEVFKPMPQNTWKCIPATNIAETSIPSPWTICMMIVYAASRGIISLVRLSR